MKNIPDIKYIKLMLQKLPYTIRMAEWKFFFLQFKGMIVQYTFGDKLRS